MDKNSAYFNDSNNSLSLQKYSSKKYSHPLFQDIPGTKQN